MTEQLLGTFVIRFSPRICLCLDDAVDLLVNSTRTPALFRMCQSQIGLQQRQMADAIIAESGWSKAIIVSGEVSMSPLPTFQKRNKAQFFIVCISLVQ